MLPRLRLLTLSPTGPISVGSFPGAIPLPSTLLLTADSGSPAPPTSTPGVKTVTAHAAAGPATVATGGIATEKTYTENHAEDPTCNVNSADAELDVSIARDWSTPVKE